MKYTKTVTNLSAGELAVKVTDLERQIAKIRLEKNIGKNRNLRQGFILRKQLAVVKTLINKAS
jgi:ribosomal protein L29